MGKDNKGPLVPPEINWGDEQTQVTEAPQAMRDDEIKESVSKIRESLKKHPSFDGYMKLIDILLNYILSNRKWTNELLDKLLEVTEDYKEWEAQKK